MTTDLTSLHKVLTDLNKFMSELSALEQEKLNAVLKKDLNYLDECMRKQQAQVLRLRGLDITREKVSKELGLSGKKLEELLEEFPEDKRLQSEGVLLQEAKKNFHKINLATKRAIEVNLYAIKKQAEGQAVAQSSPLQSGTVFKNNSV